MHEGKFNEKIRWLVHSPKHRINNVIDSELTHINVIKSQLIWDHRRIGGGTKGREKGMVPKINKEGWKYDDSFEV